MSVADAQPDFTAWRQKNVLRPVLRMPLNVSSPSSPAALNAPLESSSTCTTSSAVSALPIPSLNGTKRAAADVAVPTTATAEAEDVVPLMPNNAKPAALQEASLSGSISVTASEQLVLERLRLLEEEHAALRSSLRERMQRTASQSLPVPRDTPTLATAAAAALSSASSRVTASSSRNSAAEEEGTAQEKYAATANNQSISPSVHASEDPTLRTQQSPSTDSLTRHVQRAEQEKAAPRFTAAVAELQSSPPARRPADAATLSLPLPQVEVVPQQQQQQQQHHEYFQLALDQLRHDVQFCASEIERLVEDQYDIRCSVRDALIGMSHRSDSALLPAASAPAMTRDAAAAAASATEEKKAVENMQQHHNGDSAGIRSSRSSDAAGDPTFSPVSSSPPAWLLPWLQQLKAEQGDHFQRLREEMVVLVCHAVAEMRHTSALVASDVQGNAQGRRSHSSSSAVQPEQQQLLVAKAGRHPSANTVVEMDPAALRQPGRSAEEPPPSLLWQRYRRLMSPTPPNRSVALSASASVAPSEAPPAFSVAAQDALWSAVLQMQRVMESQSAQIAILTERVCAAAPQITASKQQQHRESSPDDSVMSADTSSTTFSSSPSHDSPLPSKQHHYYNDNKQHQEQQQRPRSSRRSHHHHRQHQQHQKQQRVSGTSEFAELQTEMKDLRHLLRTTLERRDALPIPATAAQSELARLHHQYLQDGDASSIDSDRRSSTYARRRYVDAAAPPPPQPSAAAPVAAGRTLRAEDTRYARGVTSVGRQQQQQQQQNTPNVRLPSWQRDTPSPHASPIPAEWRDEYGSQADAAPETHTTPPELPRRRVRTVLTSSLVYPPA